MKRALQWGLAAFMVGAGVLHFVRPAFYVALMPPQLPAHLALVYLSGAAEIGLGIALMIPRGTRLAAWGIVALLIAVYPANIYHALSGGLDDPALPEAMASATVAWARLPLQFLFLAWAWWYTRPATDSPPPAA